jgi:hypothetical protein
MTQRKTTRAPQKKKTAAKAKTPKEAPATANPRGGEGDYESAERYQREATSFAHSGRVEQAAEDAREAVDSEEADELTAAEATGRSRSRGEDPRNDDE